jgi:hypothetical protein
MLCVLLSSQYLDIYFPLSLAREREYKNLCPGT